MTLSSSLWFFATKLFYLHRQTRSKKGLRSPDQECRQWKRKHPGNYFGIKLHNNKKGELSAGESERQKIFPQQSIEYQISLKTFKVNLITEMSFGLGYFAFRRHFWGVFSNSIQKIFPRFPLKVKPNLERNSITVEEVLGNFIAKACNEIHHSTH